MPKRKRPTAVASSGKKNTGHIAPTPVPDPPASLIKLLQKDKKVLQYFTSLQENLNLDVKRWKNKALEYKAKAKKLQEQNDDLLDSKNKKNKNHRRNSATNGNKGKSGTNGYRGDELEAIEDIPLKTKDKPSKKSTPVQSVEVPKRDGLSDPNAERKKHAQDIDQDEESSLSDDSLMHQPNKRKKSNMHSSNQKLRHNDGNPAIESTVSSEKEGASITDKDFFSELPSGSEESDHSDSSSSGSFGDIEAELNYTNENVKTNSTRNGKKYSRINAEKSSDIQTFASEEDRDKMRKKALDWLLIALKDLKMIGVEVVDIQRPHKTISEDKEVDTNKDVIDIELNKGKGNEDTATGDIMDFDFDDLGDSSDSSDSNGNVVGFLGSRKKSMKVNDVTPGMSTPGSTTEIIPQKNVRPTVTRRLDGDVIKDIFRSLRSLIRTPTLEVDSVHFQPFLSKKLIPACYPVEDSKGHLNESYVVEESNVDDQYFNPPHPLVSGLNSLERVMAIIDTYASKYSGFSDPDEWEKMLAAGGKYMDAENDDDWEDLESIRIGLLNRDIVNTIHSSLEGEITQHWAVVDRTARFEIVSADNDAQFEEEVQNFNHNISDEKEGEKFVKNFNSKNRNKLFGLLERICLANVVSSLHQYRGDLQSAAQVVFDYIISTAPSLPIEDYPRYAPALSFCVLESMLKNKSPLENKIAPEGDSWFSNFLIMMDYEMESIKSLLNEIIEITAKIWRQRNCGGEKIKGVSAAELAAYARLLQSENKWLTGIGKDHACDELVTDIDLVWDSLRATSIDSTVHFSTNKSQVQACLSSQLILHLIGNISTAMNYIEQVAEYVASTVGKERTTSDFQGICLFMMSCVATSVQLQQLKWDADCVSNLSTELVTKHINDDNRLGRAMDKLILKLDCTMSMNMDSLVPSLLRSCILCSDGARAFQVARAVCKHWGSSNSRERRALELISRFPIVRVINLKCREDRLKQFTTYARRFRLLTVLALSPISDETSQSSLQNSSFWNSYANNGKDIGHLAFEQRMSTILPKNKSLNDYVSTHWRPSDLRTFDTNARRDDSLVRTSVSERACALSHISSWKSVEKSILSAGVHSEEDHLLQLFRISGFATGAPFLIENEGMPPTPVCVIFEDDAMLVDQFNDKLSAILKELPRDFHFCSIGYR